MATAAVLTYPTHGHVAPTLAVVTELVRRGERVIYYSTGRFRGRIEATGCSFHGYGRGHDEFNPTPPSGGLFSDMARLAALTADILPDLVDQLRDDAPDYLLFDTKSLWGRLAAQILGLPAVTMSVVFALTPEVVSVPELLPLLYAGAAEDALLHGLLDLSRYLEITSEVDSRHGTCSPDIIGYLGNPQPLNIVFTARDFQPGGEHFGDEFKFVGTSLLPHRDASCEFPFEQLSGARLIYISLGTTFNDAPGFYRACFEALAEVPCQVVLSTGGRDARALGQAPPNFLVREYVPQLLILERAALFITHGGMNSANEGLLHGVPLLVVPQRGDQHLVGFRVAAMGVGRTIAPHDLTATSLRQATLGLLADKRVRQAAVCLGASLRGAGGYGMAADEILGHLRGRRGANQHGDA